MGLFNLLGGKKAEVITEADKILDGDESPDIVIPNHAKPKEAKPVAEKKTQSKALFRVGGVYAVGGDVMLSGHCESGKLKKKMKVKINDKESVITDIKKGSDSVLELVTNEEGTIFLRGKNLFLVRTQDLLEFK
jgi:hypothetical protein